MLSVRNFSHAMKIDRADHIHIVQDERSFERVGTLEKKPGGFFQAAAGVEQDFFARDFNAHAEIIVGFQVVDESDLRSDGR